MLALGRLYHDNEITAAALACGVVCARFIWLLQW